jgi:predicted nucleotidyltransferase component of viral defense system
MASPIESLLQKYNPRTPVEFENALKEIIQEITLVGLSRSKFFNKAAFYGGTALRIFYGLPLYSEDLDFTLFKSDSTFKLKPYFSSVEVALESFGFSVKIEEVQKTKPSGIESAFLKANTRMHLLKIDASGVLAQKVHSNAVMTVKFEVDIDPPLGFESEVKVLLPPITASIAVLKPSSLFAGKMHAVLFRNWKGRVKGRDFYDLLWYLGQGIPLNLRYLEAKMKEGGKLNRNEDLMPDQVLSLLDEKLVSVDWSTAKSDIARFIPNPEESEPWDTNFFRIAVQRLVFLNEQTSSSLKERLALK